ncbi:PREDICTED: pentatricopeptide repeat-containing protein At1g71490 [Tarenaya hassleriana]|uniref:pentatricopeptide repeat-containing protein At1g71490 n=1 Tax=Tarenaya hassleriana TaxID=28532 RepID=UPI00053CA772|nr:PREDICTED: pentatricopeptide repeat-containing protein At1g71490 [Tarenaya hassleriana]XP_010534129.1 PREDICTED: pentatricopeptide repeat-containing protein At1g71490 [Tarenaya hassleriana]XP_010534130.1 PREDICTED: pentatricopeptide repeat-containing protein At1g71490 [Tarenaya hassleriana]
MLSSSSRPIPRALTISQILKFIPSSWKKSPTTVPATTKTQDETMFVSLFESLDYFASRGLLSDAFRVFSLLRLQPSSSAISCGFILHSAALLLSACVDLHKFDTGRQIHALAISSGLEYHPVLVRKLVTFYSSFNLLAGAEIITQNSESLDPSPWNVLIASYARSELFEDAVGAYKRMVSKGIRPDAFTYPSVLKACAKTLDFASGRMVHGSIEVSSHRNSLYVRNALISMYSKFGKVNIARMLFDKMPERDAVSWNAIISCYASEGMWAKASELFDEMRFSVAEVNVITWNTVAGGLLRTGNHGGVLGLVSEVRNRSVSLDPVAIIIGLGACSDLGAIRLGKEIHGLAIRSFFTGIQNVQNTLISMYSKCNDHRHAFMVFQQIQEKSLTNWNSIISGFARVGGSEETSSLFKEMLLSGFQPNYVTLATILPLCASVANLQHGKELHCYILRRQNFEDCLILWNSLLNMYAKSGKMAAAKRVFNSMNRRDNVTYTSLIDGYGMQGEGRVALALFQEMIRSHIKPDHVTMVAVLSACSHSRLVHEGQRLFEKMESKYGIHPCLEHFACMVDLYGRAGLLSKARDIIQRMPYEPSSAIWATLLGACLIHGNIYMGEWAAEMLWEMKPENPGYYVLMANLYAAAGCWNKLAEVRTLMRDLGVKKAPGRSWVDLGAGSSQFSVEDTSNPQAQRIYPLLDGMNELMKDAVGYVFSQEQSSEELLEEVG